MILNGTLDPVSAGVSAVVSAAGTIQSLSIINPGSGYTGASVAVKISSPPRIIEISDEGEIVSVGSTATATIAVGVGGTLTTPITITNPGFGYTNSYTNFVGIVRNIIGTVGIRTTIITGITTTGIVIGQTLQKVDDIIGSGTTVTSIGIGEIFINPKTLNSTNNSNQNIDFLTTTITTGQTVGIGSTVVFVDSVKNVSIGSSISITEKLNRVPVVSIGNTFVIIGTGSTIDSTITAGIAATFSNFGVMLSFGSYITTTSLSQPKVIVPLPDPIYENITNISLVNGFSGIITGITTTTGSGGNPLALRFHLNSPSFAGLSTGYPIYIFDTRVGKGVTSIDTSNSAVVGIGTTFADNIYYIHQFSSSGAVGIITCNILSTTSTIGLSSSGNVSNPIGKFSWGRMSGFSRSSSPISIGVTGNTVDVGLTTFATIQRRGIGIRQTGALPKLL